MSTVSSIVLSLGMVAYEAVGLPQPIEVVAEPSEIDLPALLWGDVARVDLTLANRGSERAEIEWITIPDTRFAIVRSEDSRLEGAGTIRLDPPLAIEPDGRERLVLETVARRGTTPRRIPGFEKRVFAGIRGEEQPIRLAVVRGSVSLGFDLVPGLFDFGSIRRGEESSLEAELVPSELGDLAITGVEAPAALPLTITWERIEGGSTPVRTRIRATVRADAAVGAASGLVRLATDHPRVPTIAVHCQVKVRPRLAIEHRGREIDAERGISLGVLRGPDDVRTIVIRNLDPSIAWNPRAARFEAGTPEASAALEVTLGAGENALERVITVRCVAAPAAKVVRGRLRFDVGHADLSEVTLDLSAIAASR